MSNTLISGATSIRSGSPYILNFNVPAQGSTSNWTVNWGDGTTPQIVSGNAATASHQYASGITTASISATLSSMPKPLDTSFGNAGKINTDMGSAVDQALDVEIVPASDSAGNAGKIVVAGGPGFSIARYNANGSLDTAFGTGGKSAASGTGSAVALSIQSDGKYLVGGGQNFEMARFNADGTIDTSFGTSGIANSGFGTTYSSSDLAVLASGKIIQIGNNGDDIVIARFNANGSVDTTFGTGGKITTASSGSIDKAYSLTIDASGRFVVVGQEDTGTADYNWAILRYAADGTLDSTFGTGGKVITDFGSTDDAAMSADIQSDGKIVVTGRTNTTANGYDFALARYNTNGSLDTSFGSAGKLTTDFDSGDDQAYRVKVLADGRIAAIGRAEGGTTGLDFAIAIYQSDGQLDTSFGTGGTYQNDLNGGADEATALAVQADGDLVIAGDTTTSGASNFALVRYHMSSAGSLTPGFQELSMSGAATIAEHSPYTLTLTRGTTTGAIQYWLVNWGDGTAPTLLPPAAGTSTTAAHRFLDGTNDYAVTAMAVIDGISYSAGVLGTTGAVHVTNVAPALSATGASTANTGEPYTLTLASSDVGQDQIDHWTIDWGDDTDPQTVSGRLSNVLHTFDTAGTFAVIATATDEDGTYTATSPTIVVSAPMTSGDDAYAVAAGATLTIAATDGVLANDDPSGGSLIVSDFHQPQHGVLTLDTATGAFTYVPDASFTGVDAFTYRASDGSTVSRWTTVTLSVNANNAPVATGDSYAVHAGTSLTISAEDGVLANDFDADGDAITGVKINDVSHGTLTFAADGSFAYTPEAGYVGDDAFTYRATDSIGQSQLTTVIISVSNGTPESAERTYDMRHGDTLVVDAANGLLAGAMDAEGDTLTAANYWDPQRGSFTLSPDGSFTYTPTTNFTGTDGFYFTISDGLVTSDPIHVTINVSNTPTSAHSDVYLVPPNGSTFIPASKGVLQNDLSPDGDALSVTISSYASHGWAALNADGSFTYTPYGGYVGSDTFSYQVSDGVSTSAPITVALSLIASVPVSAEDSYNTPHGTDLIVNAADGVLANDGAAGTLAAGVVDAPAHGTLSLSGDGSFVYTPYPGFSGFEWFTYRAWNGSANSAITRVSINVTNNGPLGQADNYTVKHDRSTWIDAASGVLANDRDADSGDTLQAARVTGPSHGSLWMNADGSFYYTPNGGYVGQDKFTYSVTDGTSAPQLMEVVLNVVNTPPKGVNDAYSATEDGSLYVGYYQGVLQNDSDDDQDGFGAQLVTQPAHGTLVFSGNGSFQYTPDANYFGDDQFVYRPGDSIGLGAGVAVDIQVQSINDLPSVNVPAFNAHGGGTIKGNVLAGASDVEQDALTAALVSGAAHGTVVLKTNGNFVYTAQAVYTGDDSFQFSVSDGHGTTSPLTVSINVANSAPVTRDGVPAGGPSYQAVAGQTLTVPKSGGVLHYVQDADGDPLTATLVGGPSHGTLTLAPDGSFMYTPAAGYTGTDGFLWVPQDAMSSGAAQTVQLVVSAAQVYARPDQFQVKHDRTLTVPAHWGVAANDWATSGTPVTVQVVTGPMTGATVSLSADGSFVYTPKAGYVGSDSFTYNASDGVSQTSAVTVTLNVTNHPPKTATDSYTVSHDQSLSIAAIDGLLVNDSDDDGDTLSALPTGVSRTEHGSITLSTNGAFNYTPDAGYVGPDSFIYTASDVVSSSIDTLVAINVGNTAPAVSPDALRTMHDTDVTGNVLGNDYDTESDAIVVSTVASNVVGGTVELQADGNFTFTPDTGFVGQASFGYTASDGQTESGGSVTIDVWDNAPLANSDTITGNASGNSEITGNVITNDRDPDQDEINTDPQTINNGYGTLDLDNEGNVTFSPSATFTGPYTFNYTLRDSAGMTAVATATIELRNIAPQGVPDYVTGNGAAPLSVNVLTNDSDPDGPPPPAESGLTAHFVGATPDATGATIATGIGGTFTLTSAGQLTYTPNAGYVGTDTAQYVVSDGHAESNPIVVTVSVVNAKPIAVADGYQVDLNTATELDVLKNDIDDGDPSQLHVTIIRQPAHGTLSSEADESGNPADAGKLTYTPDDNYSGTDSFDYQVSDGWQTSDVATVKLSVGQSYVLAVDDKVSTAVNTSTTLDLRGNDIIAESPYATIISINGTAIPPDGGLDYPIGTAHGQITIDPEGQITFTPRGGFIGTDTFNYVLGTGQPGNSQTSSGTVTIHVTATPPQAVDDTIDVTENAGQIIDVLDNDTAGDDDSQVGGNPTVTQQPRHGTVWFDQNGMHYTPAANYIGPDSFRYTIKNQQGLISQPAKVTIQVNADSASVNAEDDDVTTPSNTQITIDPLSNDSGVDDPYNRAFAPTITAQPSHGTVSVDPYLRTILYTPAAEFSGDDTFTYKVTTTDGGSSTAVVHVTVLPGTGPIDPHADTLAINEDISGSVAILANDGLQAGTHLQTLKIISTAKHGTAWFDGSQNIFYTPSANFNGTDSITYAVYDSNGSGGTATVNITVSPVNDAPVASPDTGKSIMPINGASATINVLGNDTDADGDILTIASVTAGGSGYTASVSGDSIRFDVSDYTQIGSAVWATYTIQDPSGATSSTTVFVPVASIAPQVSSIDQILNPGESVDAWVETTVEFSVVNLTDAPIHVRTDGQSVELSGGGTSGQVQVSARGTIADDDPTVTWDDASASTLLFVYSLNTIESVRTTANVWAYAETAVNDTIAGQDVLVTTRRLTGDVEASRDVQVIVAESSEYRRYTGGTITGDIYAGRDITSVLGGEIDGSIVAEGVIGQVQATSHNLTGDVIALGGGIESVSAANDITGNVAANEGDLGSVTAGHDISGSIGSMGSIDFIQAGHTLSGSISANGVLIGSIVAGGDIAGAISNGGGAINIIAASQDISSTIGATGNIGSISAGGDLSGTVTAGGSLGDLSAGENVSASFTASGDISSITAGGNNNAKADADGAIGTVASGRTASLTLNAGTDITNVHSNGAMNLHLTAGGDVDTISSKGTLSGSIDVEGNIATITSNGLDASITAVIAAGGDIGSVTASGDVSHGSITNTTITAGGKIVLVHTNGDLDAYIRAQGDIADLISDSGSIMGIMISDQGSIKHISAGMDINSIIKAAVDIGVSGGVRAGGNIVSAINAGRTIASLTASTGSIGGDGIKAGMDIGPIYAGGSISSSAITAKRNIGSVTAGGNISGTITATQGTLGDVLAGLAGQGGNISSGLHAGQSIGVIEARSSGGPANISDVPDVVPAFDQDALNLNNLGAGDAPPAPPTPNAQDKPFATVGGSISGVINAGTSISSITAGGGITQAVTAGTNIGPILALGDIGGALTAIGGTIDATTWGKISGAVVAKGNVTLRTNDGITGAVTSNSGDVTIITRGGVANVTANNNITITAVGNLGSDVLSHRGKVNITTYGEVTGNITAKNGAMVKAADKIGHITIRSGGDIRLVGWHEERANIEKLQSANVLTSSVIAYSTGIAGGDIAAAGNLQIVASGYTGNADAGGSLSINTLHDADGNFTAHKRLTIQSEALGGTVQGEDVVIDAFGDVDAEIKADASLDLQTTGKITKAVKVTNGGGTIFARGAVSTVEAKNDITVTSWGTVDAVTSHNGSVTVQTYGGLVGDVSAANNATVVSWAAISHKIDASTGAIKVFSSGDISGAITAVFGDISAVTWGTVTGVINAGRDAAVTARGNVQAAVTGDRDAIVAAGGNITASITATTRDAAVDATGAITGGITGQDTVTVRAGSIHSNIGSSEGSVDIASQGDITSNITAATKIAVRTGGNASVHETLTSDAGSVTLNALGNITSAIVTANNGDVALFAGGNADVTVAAGARNASAVAFGTLKGTMTASEALSISAWGDISQMTATTTAASSNLVAYAGGTLDASLDAADDLSVTAQGDASGVYFAADNPDAEHGDVEVTSLGNVSAVIAGASASVIAGGNISGDISADGGAASVVAGGEISGDVYGLGDVSVTALGGDISGAVTSGTGSATVFSSANITQDVIANAGSASVTALTGITASVTAGLDVSVSAGLEMSGTITAGRDASVFAGSFDNGAIIAGRDASVVAVYAFNADVSAGDDSAGIWGTGFADVRTGGVLAGQINSASGANVFSNADISGSIHALSGDVTVAAGGNMESDIDADDGAATVDAVGNVSGHVMATGDVSITSFRGVSGNVTGANASVSAVDDITGNIHATAGDLSATTLGAIDGTTSASRDINLTSYSGIDGAVHAGRSASVFTWGGLQANITADTGDADLTAWGAIEGDVTATDGNANVTAMAAIQGGITAGQDATLAAYGIADVQMHAGHDANVSSYDLLTANVTAGHAADVSGQSDVSANVTADGPVSLLAVGDLSGVIDSQSTVSATATGLLNLSTISATGDVSLTGLGGLTGHVQTDGDISASTWGAASSLLLNAGGDISLTAAKTAGGELTSSGGSIAATIGQGGSLILNAHDDIDVIAVNTINLQADAGRDVSVFGGGNVGGLITAGRDLSATAMGTFTADTNASRDAQVMAVGDIAATIHAGQNLTVVSYGTVDATGTKVLSADGDISEVVGREGVQGTITAGGDIDRVMSYADLDATITASGTVSDVSAWGDITGSITGNAVTSVTAGKTVTASISDPSVVTTENNPAVFGTYPQDPDISLASVTAALADGAKSVKQLQADLLAQKSATAQQMAAARAGAQQQLDDLIDQMTQSKAATVGEIESANAAVADATANATSEADYAKSSATAELHNAIETAKAQSAHDQAADRLELSAETQAMARIKELSQQAVTNGQSTGTQLQLSMAKMLSTMTSAQDIAKGRRTKAYDAALNSTAHLVWNAQGLNDTVWDTNIGGYKISEWWEIGKGAMAGAAQGGLNAINGLQDQIIDTANQAISLTGATAVAGYLGYDITIPSPDWSKGLITSESDTAHGISKGLGGFGLSILAPMGIAKIGETIFAEGGLACRLGFSEGCFTAGTQVAVGVNADGTLITKNIEDIKVGDLVLSRDQNDPTGALVLKPVTDLYLHTSTGIRLLDVQASDGNVEHLQTTDPHPFYVVGHGWTAAGQLQIGDVVEMEDGSSATITSTTLQEHAAGELVYNLEVDGTHSYFVDDGQGLQSAVWVHNGIACIQGHHPIPKFLGGEEVQSLYNVKSDIHAKFHKELYDELSLAFTEYPDVPSGWKTSEWLKFFRQNPEAQHEALEAVHNVSKSIDSQLSTSFTKNFMKNIKAGNFINLL